MRCGGGRGRSLAAFCTPPKRGRGHWGCPNWRQDSPIVADRCGALKNPVAKAILVRHEPPSQAVGLRGRQGPQPEGALLSGFHPGRVRRRTRGGGGLLFGRPGLGGRHQARKDRVPGGDQVRARAVGRGHPGRAPGQERRLRRRGQVLRVPASTWGLLAHHQALQGEGCQCR